MSTSAPSESWLDSLQAGWYAFKSSSGAVGIVKHNGNGSIKLGNGEHVASATYLGPADQTMADLVSNSGPKVQAALVDLGATERQMLDFISSTSEGVVGGPRLGGGVGGGILNAFGIDWITKGKNPTQINFPAAGNPTASAGAQPLSTGLQGSADAGPSVTPNLSGLLKLLESLSLWKGVGLVLAGAAIIVFAAMEFRHV